jgi:hypothetical protein
MKTGISRLFEAIFDNLPPQVFQECARETVGEREGERGGMGSTALQIPPVPNRQRQLKQNEKQTMRTFWLGKPRKKCSKTNSFRIVNSLKKFKFNSFKFKPDFTKYILSYNRLVKVSL